MLPSTTLLNQGLMLADQGSLTSAHMAFFHQDSSLSNLGFLPYGCHHPSRAPNDHSPMGDAASQLRENMSTAVKSKHGDAGVLVEAGASLVQKSSNGMWPWAEDEQDLSSKRPTSSIFEEKHNNSNNNLSAAGMKMKKVKARRKVREPRFCFKTMSDVDVLDDGYKWRKYGQKVVKNTQHPRSYYRCTQDNCRVKKRVERLAEDPRMVITTYEGRHAHSPSHDADDSQPSSQFNFFW